MTRHRADRRAFVATVATGMLLMGRPAAAQSPPPAPAPGAPRVWRIGFLTPSAVSPRGIMPDMRAKLRELGYVEGRDLKFEIRAANEDFERLPDLAADLVRSGVDLIVAVSSPAIRAAENATSTIPIVMLSGTDPVAGLFVASLAHPEGNVTGLTTYVPELASKRLELLRETVPDLRRVAILANLRNPSSAVEVKEMETAARTLSIEVHVQDARLPEQYPDAFVSVARGGWRALVVTADPVLSSNRERILQLAARHRLPTMYEWKEIVEIGGLMSYGPSLAEVNGRVAVYVDKILKGASPAALPVERPTRFELAVNLKTAASLGLKFPAALVARADRVVK
ncbi:MAG TPA: ABC transporter substrate-binding protein [Candidatus Dormibacteraeota bacterium]|nr:ABC transporter substrate-binding protein [Candidatus Dormibacteraeota bacterium]